MVAATDSLSPDSPTLRCTRSPGRRGTTTTRGTAPSRARTTRSRYGARPPPWDFGGRQRALATTRASCACTDGLSPAPPFLCHSSGGGVGGRWCRGLVGAGVDGDGAVNGRRGAPWSCRGGFRTRILALGRRSAVTAPAARRAPACPLATARGTSTAVQMIDGRDIIPSKGDALVSGPR